MAQSLQALGAPLIAFDQRFRSECRVVSRCAGGCPSCLSGGEAFGKKGPLHTIRALLPAYGQLWMVKSTYSRRRKPWRRSQGLVSGFASKCQAEVAFNASGAVVRAALVVAADGDGRATRGGDGGAIGGLPVVAACRDLRR